MTISDKQAILNAMTKDESALKRLNPRECQLLQALANLNNDTQTLAAELNLSKWTVDFMKKNIAAKLRI